MQRWFGAFVPVLILTAIIGIATATAQKVERSNLYSTAVKPAQEQDKLPGDIKRGQVAGVVAGLSDVQARRHLLALLEERAAASEPAAGVGGFGVGLVRFRKAFEAAVDRLRDDTAVVSQGVMSLPDELPPVFAGLSSARGWGPLIANLIALLAVAGGLVAAARRLTRGRRARLADPPLRNAGDRVVVWLQLAALAALPVVALALGSFLAVTVFYFVGGPERNVIAAVLSGTVLLAVAAYVAELLLAPAAASVRLLPLGDRAARFCYDWFLIVAAVNIFLWLLAGLIILEGVSMPVHLVIVLAVGALTSALLMAIVVQARHGLRALIIGDEPNRTRRGLAAAAPYLTGLYIVIAWLHWADAILARQATGIWAAVMVFVFVVSLPAIDRWAKRTLIRFFRVEDMAARTARVRDRLAQPADHMPARGDDVMSHELAEAEAQFTARQRYVQVTMQSARILAAALALFLILSQLGFDITGSGSVAAQAWLLSALVSVLITLAVAYLLWRLFVSYIGPYMPAERHVVFDDEDGGTPGTRLETLVPLLRNTVRVVLVVFAIMIALSNIGADVGPLIAGASVIGIAIGFGAQRLVQDVVSGIFFLIDDAFRLGEYIEFDTLRGEVVAISLRALTLRHHRGALHTIPYSELKTVTNYNRDWIIYKMEFRLPLAVDVKQIKRLIEQVGSDMAAHPEWGPKLLQPLKSQGIQRMDESALVLRVKFMCKPREQFVLRRVAYQMIKDAFTSQGIAFAARQAAAVADDPAAQAARVPERTQPA